LFKKEEYKMAKLSTKEIIDSIKEMTILEVKDLVDAMKEEFGVDPSAVAVAAPVAGAVVEEGPSSVDVVLASAGANKIAVIKLVREITGLGLKEAKDIADNGGVVKEKASADEANEIKAKFEEAGASIELK
jgi:large subunit ribosomal protein L7/L12